MCTKCVVCLCLCVSLHVCFTNVTQLSGFLKKKFYGVNLSNQPHNLLLHSPTAWLECTEINRVIHFPCGQRLLLLILEDVILWEGKWCRWPVTEVKGHSSRSFVWLWFLRVTARPIIFRGEVCLLRSSVRFSFSLWFCNEDRGSFRCCAQIVGQEEFLGCKGHINTSTFVCEFEERSPLSITAGLDKP